MKLKQIVIDKTDLTLTKEKKTIKYGEEFEVKDEARVNEILNATYKGKPVAALVEEVVIVDDKDTVDGSKLNDDEVIEVVAKEVKKTKRTTKKVSK